MAIGLISAGAGLLSRAADRLFSGEMREQRKEVRAAKKTAKKAAKVVKQTGKVVETKQTVLKENVAVQFDKIKNFVIAYWYVFAIFGVVIILVVLYRRGIIGKRRGNPGRRRYSTKKKSSGVSGLRSRSGRLTGQAFVDKMRRAKEAKARQRAKR